MLDHRPVPSVPGLCPLFVRGLCAAIIAWAPLGVCGQASTDPCGFTAGAEWTVGASCNPIPFAKPATYNANMNPAGCHAGNYDDAFAWFAGTGGSVTVQYTPPGGADAVLHVLSGTCAAPVVVACSDNCCGGAVESVAIPTVLGTNYIVRVQRYNNNSAMNGSLCVFNTPPPPANDNPCGATPLPVGTTCTYTTGTNANATATTGVPDPTCANYAGSDVWFSVVVPPSGTLIIDSNTGGIIDGGMALYTATSCSGTFTQIACDDDGSDNGAMPMINASGLAPGSTVYVRFWGYGSYSTGTFSICAQSYTPPPPPACGEDYFDPGGPAANYPNNSNIVQTICPDNPGEAVSLIFSSFHIEATFDVLRIYNGPSTASPLLGSFSGNGLPPILTSTDPSGCLTVAFTSDGSVNYPGWAATVLCQPRPSGDCILLVSMLDSGGDGWGSSQVGVRINGGAWTYYTVAGVGNSAILGVNLGDLVEVQYIGTGPNQGQNSYTVSKVGQTPYFTSTTPPATGITFTQIVNCGPPPAPPQDCQGGITVCSDQNITNNSDNTGQVMDLNSSNEGCLSSGERQGTWYYFSPESAGTVAFSISPVADDDYDFAVWGPYTEAQCPSGPPLRCSYDAPGPYVTGLNATATATTEGAGGTGWVQDLDVQPGEVYVLYIDNFSTSGQAFTLSWQLSGGTSLDCATLPVELITLDAVAHDPVIHVLWSTASEQGTHHFTVERSPDNNTFAPIGTVNATGNTQFRTDYLFVDEHPFRGPNYYRLQQTDADGSTKPSYTVVASLAQGSAVSIYPNPATDVLQVAFAAPLPEGALLRLEDALGRLIGSVRSAPTGQHAMSFPLAGLANGWYQLRIVLPGGSLLPGGAFVKQ